MNWLQKVSKSSLLIKTASQSMFSDCAFNGNNTTINVNQEGSSSGYHSDDDPNDVYSSTIRNNDRYGSDTHKVWIIRTAHKNGLSLALEVKAERDGMLSYSDYWHYDSSESGIRDASFEKLVSISHGIKDKIENHHLPVAMIATLFKSSTRYLDLPYKEKSSVDNFNRSLEMNSELDWRNSLYGSRYPKVGNNGPLHETWKTLNTEQSSEIKYEGNPRNRSFNIQYGS